MTNAINENAGVQPGDFESKPTRFKNRFDSAGKEVQESFNASTAAFHRWQEADTLQDAIDAEIQYCEALETHRRALKKTRVLGYLTNIYQMLAGG